jgi:hypothetical protein
VNDPVIYKEIWNDMIPLGRCVLFVPLVFMAYLALIVIFLGIPLMWILIKLDKPVGRMLNIKRFFFKEQL